MVDDFITGAIVGSLFFGGDDNSKKAHNSSNYGQSHNSMTPEEKEAARKKHNTIMQESRNKWNSFQETYDKICKNGDIYVYTKNPLTETTYRTYETIMVENNALIRKEFIQVKKGNEWKFVPKKIALKKLQFKTIDDLPSNTLNIHFGPNHLLSYLFPSFTQQIEKQFYKHYAGNSLPIFTPPHSFIEKEYNSIDDYLNSFKNE